MALPLLTVHEVERVYEELTGEMVVELEDPFEHFDSWWVTQVPLKLWNVPNLQSRLDSTRESKRNTQTYGRSSKQCRTKRFITNGKWSMLMLRNWRCSWGHVRRNRRSMSYGKDIVMEWLNFRNFTIDSHCWAAQNGSELMHVSSCANEQITVVTFSPSVDLRSFSQSRGSEFQLCNQNKNESPF